MSEGLLGSDALFGVEHQHVLEKIDSCKSSDTLRRSSDLVEHTSRLGVLELVRQRLTLALRQRLDEA